MGRQLSWWLSDAVDSGGCEALSSRPGRKAPSHPAGVRALSRPAGARGAFPAPPAFEARGSGGRAPGNGAALWYGHGHGSGTGRTGPGYSRR
ncbi:hypothetical protein GCM10010215_04350 [Streptomyces virginiae]|nr:hypothetical protein GCM10010215_04350 [Streptomyces virginiae]GLV93293.1 hypothetical protein Slala04_47470 [Streptomyces lavendulae subsp. lavendulae]